mgnify:CR=1 FL=1
MDKQIHGRQEIENRFLATVACKAAIKGNKELTDMEIKSLLDEILSLDNPFTCPHGRPTIIAFSKDQLIKMFKRDYNE